MKRKIQIKSIINISIASFFIICVMAPVISMLCRITPNAVKSVVESPQFKPAVWNSVSIALVATTISLVVSMFAALCMERTAIKLKSIWNIIFIIPMLIPSISHAFGIVALFGANGVLTKFFKLDGSIYGFWGMVTGAVMYSFPVLFLMFINTLRYEDGMSYKAAEVLGIPPIFRFKDITMPYLKKTVISAFFAGFTMIITDYGVPLMVGGKKITLAVLMYNKAISMLDYSSGSVIGTFLLLPAIVAFLVDLLNPEKGQNGFSFEPVIPKKKIFRDSLSYIFCTSISICVLAPVIAFCMMTFETKYPVDKTFTLYHIQKTMNRGAGTYLINSIFYAVLVAIFGTILAFVCAYLTARVKDLFSRWLHLISVMSMAIPGIVLGISYVIFFHNMPLYGTIFIIILVNSIHFFASPYLMIYNALGKVNPNLEAVGESLGVRRIFIIKDIIIPKVKYTICEMFVYFFINSMMTISAVSFLAPPSPKPVALMINQFEAQMLMESAAFVSLIILGVNLIVKIAFSVLKKYMMKNV